MNYEVVALVVLAAKEAEKTTGWLDIPPAWLALVGTIIGTIGLKVVESWINNPAKKDSTPAELREELRQQIEGLKEDVLRRETIIDKTEEEMLEWRDRYWKLVAEHNQMLAELQHLRAEIQEKNVSREQ